MNSWTQKKIRIDTIIEFAMNRLDSRKESDFFDFITELYKHVSPEDLSNRAIDALYASALSLWKYSEKRAPSQSKIRVFNPSLEEHGWQSSHTVIQIIQDDVPFLLDSITSNLLEDGNELHMLVHPIIEKRRDKKGAVVKKGGQVIKESVMHMEITAMTGWKSVV